MKQKRMLFLLIMISFISFITLCIRWNTSTYSKESDELINQTIQENKDARETMSKTEEEEDYKELYPEMYVASTKEIEEDDKKVAYLTFDDGPSKNTCQVLESLKEQDVKATFFILGSTMTEEGEACLKAMAQSGHTIGIHTYSHRPKSIYRSVKGFLEDFYMVYNQIYEITGIKATIYRFPWGSTNCYNKGIKKELIAEMTRRGFVYYDWNVTAEDSVGVPTEYSIMSNVLDHYKKYCKPVILMHDSPINKLTAKTLPKIIETIKDEGYEFDTLENRTPCHFR